MVREVRTRTGRIIDVQGGYPHGTPYSTSQHAWPVLAAGPTPPILTTTACPTPGKPRIS